MQSSHTVKIDDKKDFWLKLKKPKEPKKLIESQIQTPKELIIWLENLYDEGNEPAVKTEIEHNGITLFLDDKPELKEKLSNYIKNQWLDDLLQYQEKQQEYRQKQEQPKKIKLIDYLLGQNIQNNENRTSSKITTETETIYFPCPSKLATEFRIWATKTLNFNLNEKNKLIGLVLLLLNVENQQRN